jgi:hypothetical protein
MKKTYLLLASCLLFAGCNRPAENRVMLEELDAIKSELAGNRGAAVRWAFANKREIDSAIFQWNRDKMEAAKKAEALPAATEEKIRQYETLERELMNKRMATMRMSLPPRPGVREVAPPDKDYETLSNQVAEARAPIADILERRARQSAQLNSQFTTEKLVAEYVKDRFDLVVDSSDQSFSRSSVLYRANAEVLDITDGVIKLFQEKAKM